MPPQGFQRKPDGLPDKPRRDQGSGPRTRAELSIRERPRVLIVDDDQDTRDLYAWCLLASGWIVEAVVDGQDALVAAEDFAPDVIVVDLRLPVIDGFGLTRRLKADANTRHIPIVAVSGMDPRQAESLSVEAGCEVFVAKPCVPEDLRALLERMVGQRE